MMTNWMEVTILRSKSILIAMPTSPLAEHYCGPLPTTTQAKTHKRKSKPAVPLLRPCCVLILGSGRWRVAVLHHGVGFFTPLHSYAVAIPRLYGKNQERVLHLAPGRACVRTMDKRWRCPQLCDITTTYEISTRYAMTEKATAEVAAPIFNMRRMCAL